jgi:sugar phosphate isomerase/epimerase
MAGIVIGINMEFVRSADKPFAWGVVKAAELGYQYVEPMVHMGRELLSEAGYFHSFSMLDDPLAMREICDRAGVKLSGLSAHTPLAKPEISVDYLTQAIRFAAEAGAPVVNTDEGLQHTFTGEEIDHTLMQYVLTLAARAAERRNILIGIEPHQVYSQTPEGLDRIFREAGFEWREPSCSKCYGSNGDYVARGNRCVSNSNRNYIGRQGGETNTILASTTTVAASAIAGSIADVRTFL